MTDELFILKCEHFFLQFFSIGGKMVNHVKTLFVNEFGKYLIPSNMFDGGLTSLADELGEFWDFPTPRQFNLPYILQQRGYIVWPMEAHALRPLLTKTRSTTLVMLSCTPILLYRACLSTWSTSWLCYTTTMSRPSDL